MSDFDLCLQSLPSLGIFRKAPQEVLGEESVCVSRLLFTAVRGSIRIESECGQRVQEGKEGPNREYQRSQEPLRTTNRAKNAYWYGRNIGQNGITLISPSERNNSPFTLDLVRRRPGVLLNLGDLREKLSESL